MTQSSRRYFWVGLTPGRDDPAVSQKAAVVEPVPATTTEIEALFPKAKSLYVGGQGDIVVIPEDDTQPVIFKNVPAGTVLPVAVRLVADQIDIDNTTTATDIVLLN